MSHSRYQIYQIAYDATSLEKVGVGGFRCLDNMSNERPDWYEYWPIRNFLCHTSLNKETWYGFFSPRFQDKTGLKADGVIRVIEGMDASGKNPEIVLFSPQPDMGAFFINVFEQGEMFHPGLMEIAKSVFIEFGLGLPLENIVMDSRQIVFSNYFVAKRSFWEVWFEMTERIFEMAENCNHPLYKKLNAETTYRSGAHQKVFIIERVASLLMAIQNKWKVQSANTFDFAWSSFAAFNANRELAYQSDALKMAYRDCGHPQYLDAYQTIRKSIGA